MDGLWGGYSQVTILKNCLESVIRSGQFDRVVALSGMDYPAMPSKQIELIFQENPKKEYLRARIVTNNDTLSNKVTRYWRFDYPYNNGLACRISRGIHNRILGNVLHSLRIRKKDSILVDGAIWNVYFGSDYWALTYNTAVELYKYLNRKEIERYFRSSYAPSELVTTTIVCNIVNHNDIDMIASEKCRYEQLCALHYEIYDPIIQTMTEKDFQAIIDSQKMFFRKTRTGESDELCRMSKDYYRE